MPIRITRVYTRTGDAGETALVGGRRVPKDSPRIEAYGTIDELNAASASPGSSTPSACAGRAAHRRLDEILRRLQNELFDLGSELATPPDAAYEGMFRVGAEEVTALERLIDECQKDSPRSSPSSCPAAGASSGFLHQARTVCRRAERDVLALSRVEPDRRVAAQVRQPAERSPLRALALGGQASSASPSTSGSAGLESHQRKRR